MDVEDESGVTPILLAGASIKPNTLHQYEEIIDLLISHHANINIYNDFIGKFKQLATFFFIHTYSRPPLVTYKLYVDSLHNLN